MTDLLRVGVIGAGIGAGYVAGFRRQPEVEVTALCARSPERMQPVRERYGIARGYTDYRTMLQEEPLDIVAVAAPNYLHHPMAMDALNAGMHVLCDKPLAMSVAQAREMADHAGRLGLRHFVPFIWHFVPAAAYMKEIITAGFIGRPYHASARYYVNGDIQAPMGWQYDQARAGSGSLGNLGSHAIHLIQWWLGPITRVSAMTATVIKDRAQPGGTDRVPVLVDDTCAFLAELDGGVPVVFSTSSVAVVQRVSLEVTVYGSEGGLVFSDDWGAQDAPTGRILATRRNDYAPTLVTIPTRLTGEFLDMPDSSTALRACFARMAGEFVTAIRADRPAEPNFHDGVRVQEVIDAVLRSAAEDRWVTVA